LRRHSFADAAPNYSNSVANDFFSHDGIADNGVSHDCVTDDCISIDVAHANANKRTSSSGNLQFRGCCERGLLL
jgi:hypothetical protein